MVYQYHRETGGLFEVENFETSTPHDASLRCDLHPRWDRSGEQICVDSTRRRSRQLHTVDVSDIG